MKRIIPFSKFFLPAAIVSVLLIIAGIVSLYVGGFNFGVDFQAGLMQEIQFAPAAFRLGYEGRGAASFSMSRSSLTIVISGAGIDESQYDFPFSEYPTVNDLARGLGAVSGIVVHSDFSPSVRSSWLVQSAQSTPRLGTEPLVIHYLSPGEQPIPIEDVRSSLQGLGTVSVQSLGDSAERRFMIRMEDSEIEGEGVPAEKIISTLEAAFGQDGVAVTRSDYVGSRASRQLADQAAVIMALTILLILGYSAIRFKPQYAFGAVLAIIHDGLIMVAFVVWTRMEFNTTTIAAFLTILGYSINDTIVIFDRVREVRRLYPDDDLLTIINRSLTETLSRTIITTVTTLLAVLALFIFTTGSMRDFASALIVGMISGIYSTIFIACGFVNFWEKQKQKRGKKKSVVPSQAVPAKAG
jgi:preprotein translocase subunit SecF